jgi:hypothetical protein
MKNLKLLLILSLSSCASIPDVYICRARSNNTGFCTKTITSESVIVDDNHLLLNKTWLDLKLESVLVPVESWVELKTYIIKQCKKNNNCDQNIDSWTRKIDSINP